MSNMPLEKNEKELIINLMEFIYVEVAYLEAMKDMNLEG